MTDPALLAAFMDSLKHAFVFCDLDHTIQYMNRAAVAHHRNGAALLGTSVLDCHNEDSCEVIVAILARMQEDQGLDEVMITDNERWRIYMRAVRDADGALLGYYERYEPPRGE